MLKRILILTVIAVTVNSAWAVLDWNITGSGARAAGMGNAFIGLADDATAINWNPGGLTALEHFEASVVGGVVYDKEKYSYEDNYGGSNSVNSKYTHFNMNFLSLAYPFTLKEKKLVVAAAFQKQLDFFAEKERDNFTYSSEGGVYTANIGAAYQLVPYFSVGATVNLWTGSAESEEVTTGDYFEYIWSDANDNFTGFNLTAGVLFDLSAIKDNVPLKIGAVIKTPFDLEYDYSYEEIYDDYNDDNNDGSWYGESSGSVGMPFMFGIGASYRIGENFTIGIDFERRNYAKSKYKMEWEDGSTEEAYLTKSESDVNQFRIGMEYLVITDAVVIPVRCGIFNYPTLASSETGDKYWTGYYDNNGYPVYYDADFEQVVGYGVSLGTGLIFESFALDLCMNVYSYERKDELNYIDGDWAGYETVDTWTNTKATASMSAVLYLDQFIKK